MSILTVEASAFDFGKFATLQPAKKLSTDGTQWSSTTINYDSREKFQTQHGKLTSVKFMPPREKGRVDVIGCLLTPLDDENQRNWFEQFDATIIRCLETYKTDYLTPKQKNGKTPKQLAEINLGESYAKITKFKYDEKLPEDKQNNPCVFLNIRKYTDVYLADGRKLGEKEALAIMNKRIVYVPTIRWSYVYCGADGPKMQFYASEITIISASEYERVQTITPSLKNVIESSTPESLAELQRMIDEAKSKMEATNNVMSNGMELLQSQASAAAPNQAATSTLSDFLSQIPAAAPAAPVTFALPVEHKTPPSIPFAAATVPFGAPIPFGATPVAFPSK